jgi:hypothetical protein
MSAGVDRSSVTNRTHAVTQLEGASTGATSGGGSAKLHMQGGDQLVLLADAATAVGFRPTVADRRRGGGGGGTRLKAIDILPSCVTLEINYTALKFQNRLQLQCTPLGSFWMPGGHSSGNP